MTLSRLRYSGIIYLLVLFQGCNPGRSLPENIPAQAEWVRSRPVNPGYYTGIGWAKKTGNIHQYQQSAKQNALADLASEISVNISSNSVLHSFESNLGYREDFTSLINARTQEDLEGFELAGTWEDHGNYWIYYRLSAIRYKEIKERRKNDAILRSLGFLENAILSREQGNIRMNLVHLIHSLEAIKNYFEDPLPIEFRGRNIQLGNEIFNELSSSISQLQIIPHHREISVKNGHEIPSSLLHFKVSTQSAGGVPGFPLLANYSERPFRNNRARSENDGNASFGIDRVRSSRHTETFTVTADMESILSEATGDPWIKRMIGRFSIPEGVITINILKPVIFLYAKEEIMDRMHSGRTLGDNFRRNAFEAGYEFADTNGNADYIVKIKANTLASGEGGVYINVLLSGSISVELPDGKMIYHRELEGFRGSHFDFDRAAEEAYSQAVRRMNTSYFREIDEILKR
jgi:hypothetical protein